MDGRGANEAAEEKHLINSYPEESTKHEKANVLPPDAFFDPESLNNLKKQESGKYADENKSKWLDIPAIEDNLGNAEIGAVNEGDCQQGEVCLAQLWIIKN